MYKNKNEISLKAVGFVVLTLLSIGMVMKSVTGLYAKGATGEYATRVAENNTFLNPNAGSVLDQAGTVWNVVDDIEMRKFVRTESINYNTTVLASTPQANTYILEASSQLYTIDKFNFGWSIAIPTGIVTSDRIKTRIFNLPTNTQTLYVNIATGSATSGPLTYPATSQYIQDLLPGESFEFQGSSLTHVVVKSSGSTATERYQATNFK